MSDRPVCSKCSRPATAPGFAPLVTSRCECGHTWNCYPALPRWLIESIHNSPAEQDHLMAVLGHVVYRAQHEWARDPERLARVLWEEVLKQAEQLLSPAAAGPAADAAIAEVAAALATNPQRNCLITLPDGFTITPARPGQELKWAAGCVDRKAAEFQSLADSFGDSEAGARLESFADNLRELATEIRRGPNDDANPTAVVG